jgi:hypothetical protein
MTARLAKPSRGQCGTCDWFEVWPGNPDPGVPLQGSCVVNPPQPVLQVQQVPMSAIVDPTRAAQAARMQQSIQGMVPPTNEFRKCQHWRPMGTQPPFDDHIRPGISSREKEVVDATKQ